MSTVFIDVDTQLDFLYPAGALYVPGAERIVSTVAGLNRYAAQRGIPVVSTTDAHTEDDPEFRVWPHHCVAGTLGQLKPVSTLLPSRVVVPNRPCDYSLAGAQQVIVEKQTVDVFQSANLARVLDEIGARHYVVYGVVTEVCVLYAVRGLFRRKGSVSVVTDAIMPLQPGAAEAAFDEMRLGGALLEQSSALTIEA